MKWYILTEIVYVVQLKWNYESMYKIINAEHDQTNHNHLAYQFGTSPKIN